MEGLAAIGALSLWLSVGWVGYRLSLTVDKALRDPKHISVVAVITGPAIFALGLIFCVVASYERSLDGPTP